MATTVEYDGAVVATIPSGNKATIPVADKNMKTDIVITVPEAEGGIDSPLPIEVSTEAEMTALLTSGEVGGVYKYTGTTGTYENGALYVLEEEAVEYNITVKYKHAYVGSTQRSAYIKFGSAPTSDSDYDYYKSPSSSGGSGTLGTVKATTAYVWGYKYEVNDGETVGACTGDYTNAVQVNFTEDCSITLICNYGEMASG